MKGGEMSFGKVSIVEEEPYFVVYDGMRVVGKYRMFVDAKRVAQKRVLEMASEEPMPSDLSDGLPHHNRNE